MSEVQTVICTFRVKASELMTFRALLDQHWPALRDLDLVTDTPEQVFLSIDAAAPTVVSIFEWSSKEAVNQAHSHPTVGKLWGAMDPLCEPRDGRPAMEFPHFQPVSN